MSLDSGEGSALLDIANALAEKPSSVEELAAYAQVQPDFLRQRGWGRRHGRAWEPTDRAKGRERVAHAWPDAVR